MSFGRREPRYGTRLPVHYQVLEGAEAGLRVGPLDVARVSDIGGRGAFVTEAALPLSARVHFYFRLPDGCLEVFGRVVHNRPRRTPDGARRAGVGIRFTHVSRADRSTLTGFLAELRGQHHAAGYQLRAG